MEKNIVFVILICAIIHFNDSIYTHSKHSNPGIVMANVAINGSNITHVILGLCRYTASCGDGYDLQINITLIPICFVLFGYPEHV